MATLTDEGTIDGGVAKRRQQKIYADVLGRTVKTELLNWQGGNPYATTVNTYNGRDQITQIRQYAGADTSGTYQDTVMTYDGYGRLETRHVPEQNAGTHTTWTYNNDDTINTITDARNATTTFGYGGTNRHLVKTMAHTLSGAPTIQNTFNYDAAGNRISLTDSLGTVNYGFDQLSRMTSEVRYFSAPNRSYTINYEYNLANQLISLSLPLWSQQVGYNHDSAGRLSSITGSGYVTGSYQGTWPNWTWVQQSVNTFASGLTYRAGGSVKQLTYGNGLQLSVGYDARLQSEYFQVTNFSTSTTLRTEYDYYDDGAIKQAKRIDNGVFNRGFNYDHVARMKNALTGSEAQGGSTPDGPYREDYSYDSFGHTSALTSRLWTGTPSTVSQTFTNNRRSGSV